MLVLVNNFSIAVIMLLCFDTFRLVVGALAAMLVVNGVVIKNTFEQMGAPNHWVGKPMGMGMFALGWLIAAYVFGLGKGSVALRFGAAGASLSILAAVMWMKEKGESSAGMMALTMFAVSWLVLGVIAAGGLPWWGQALGVLAALLVIGSMMAALPLQRRMGVVDGPGMPMFTTAWVIIVGLNAMVR
jgi:hypothetical protein